MLHEPCHLTFLLPTNLLKVGVIVDEMYNTIVMPMWDVSTYFEFPNCRPTFRFLPFVLENKQHCPGDF